MTREIGPIEKWEVVEYEGSRLAMLGYDEEGNTLIRRHFKLEKDKTEFKDEHGRWRPLNDLDDGGYPVDATFTAYPEDER